MTCYTVRKAKDCEWSIVLIFHYFFFLKIIEVLCKLSSLNFYSILFNLRTLNFGYSFKISNWKLQWFYNIILDLFISFLNWQMNWANHCMYQSKLFKTWFLVKVNYTSLKKIVRYENKPSVKNYTFFRQLL